MDVADALIIAEHPARHEMPTLWAALRVLAPIAERAIEVSAGAIDQPVGVTGRAAAIYILGNTLPARVSPTPDTEEA